MNLGSLTFPPTKSVQAPDRWPSVCGKPGCTHMQCLNIRHQNALRCCACRELILPGAQLYILKRGEFGSVEKQMCVPCFEAKR